MQVTSRKFGNQLELEMHLKFTLPLVIAAIACTSAAAQTAPTQSETEEFIVQGIKGCDSSITFVSLQGPRLQIKRKIASDFESTTNTDLSKSDGSVDASGIKLSCTAPGCTDLHFARQGLSDRPPTVLNELTVACSAPIRERIGRALQHYQGIIGKQKPLF